MRHRPGPPHLLFLNGRDQVTRSGESDGILGPIRGFQDGDRMRSAYCRCRGESSNSLQDPRIACALRPTVEQ